MPIGTFCPDGKYHSMHQPRCPICVIESLTAELENRKKQFDDYAAAEEINNTELQKEIDEVWNTLGLAEYDGEDSASHFIEQLQRGAEKHKADAEMHRKANESLSAALRNVKIQMQNVEEREADCCPEDVGFDEYIRTLKQLLADKNTTANTFMAQVKHLQSALDAADKRNNDLKRFGVEKDQKLQRAFRDFRVTLPPINKQSEYAAGARYAMIELARRIAGAGILWMSDEERRIDHELEEVIL